MQILDLTLPLSELTAVYAEPDGYRDPPFRAAPWATIADQGYGVHRIEMGTHTGTHLDAPAHFIDGGRTVDRLPPEGLVGQAIVIDLRDAPAVTPSVLAPFGDRVVPGWLPLFVAPGEGIWLARDAVDAVAGWRPTLILYAGRFLDDGEDYYHNRIWLGADIPMVTDLDTEAAGQVQDGDLLIVAPLPLVGLDGSPCRVLALRDWTAPESKGESYE
jgi:arylformamidase